MRTLAVVALCVFAACGGAPDSQTAAKKKAAPPPAEKPRDLSHRLPKTDRVSHELVTGHMLGKEFLPGGNLAEYEKDGKKYQVFLIETKSPDQAAFLMYDYKAVLEDSKFLAHMGGFFGHERETPVLVFPKKHYLIGIVGLPQEEADMAGRGVASRIE